MIGSRQVTIIQVRTNLGLVEGVEHLGEVLVEHGLAQQLDAQFGPIVDAPPYSAERSHESGLLNAEGLADVARRQAVAVGLALDRGGFPLVLGGDDSTLFGSVLALRRRGRYGLVFLDAHIDFYPPEQSPSGEASDSDLYLALGFGPKLIADLDARGPLVRGADTVVIGHRDEAEQADTGQQLRATDAVIMSLRDVRERGTHQIAQGALAHMRETGVAGFLIHIDADVLDDELMPAVDYRVPGGLTQAEFAELVGSLLADELAIGLEVTIYNPLLDSSRAAGRNLTACLVDAFNVASRG